MTKYTIIQPPMIEQKARNLKPGTWVRIAWNDSEPTAALFLGYVGGSKRDGNYRADYRGDRSIECFYPEGSGNLPTRHSHAQHTQVIEIMGALSVPQ